MQIKTGFVTVTPGSATVLGTGTNWDGLVTPGDIFVVSGDVVSYQIASVEGDGELTLTAPWQGEGVLVEEEYGITRDFTPNRNYPTIHRQDIETAAIITRALIDIDADIAFIEFAGQWQTSQEYVAKTIVARESGSDMNFYIANISHTSNAGNDPLEEDGTWTLLFSSSDFNTVQFATLSWEGEWQDNTEYFEGNVVREQNTLYVATSQFTSGATFDPDNWDVFIDLGDLDQAVLDAQAARDKAEEWAQNPEDTPVETSPDQFSALHWSAKAEGFAGDAEDSATDADNSAQAAATSEANALASEQNASDSETNAATSEGNASDSADLAQEWAAKPEDEEVTGGLFSALHYAAKADESAGEAEASETKAQQWAAEDEDVVVEGGLFSSLHYAAKSAQDASDAAQSASDAEGSATTATNAANAAEGFRDAAEGFATDAEEFASRLRGTSTSSVGFGSGTKTFTTQENKFFDAGNFILVVNAQDESEFMFGQATSYTGTTLEIDVVVFDGSGTNDDWLIRLAGARGAQGLQGEVGNFINNYQGGWIPGQYEEGDIVAHEGSSWLATAQTTEEPSLSATDWDVVALKGSDGSGNVNTVFGRGGPDVLAESGDYDAIQITFDPSENDYTTNNVQEALEEVYDVIPTDTDELSEGVTNLYFTDDRAASVVHSIVGPIDPPLSLNYGGAKYKHFTNPVEGIEQAPFETIHTFTRNSPATAWIPSGKLVSVAAHEPRATTYDPTTGKPLGILIEGSRTNLITNSVASGATVGVLGSGGALPTGWSLQDERGLTYEVAATGVEDGINYIDLKVSGTPTSTGVVRARFSNTLNVTADDPLAASAFVRAVGGSTTNLTSILLSTNMGALGNTFDPFAEPSLRKSRRAVVGTVASTTAGGQLFQRFAVTNGEAVDITFRMGLPQYETATFPSSPILTEGSAVTRQTDNCIITDLDEKPWWNPVEWTIVCSAVVPGYLPATEQALFDIQEGSARFGFWRNSPGRLIYIGTGGAGTSDNTPENFVDNGSEVAVAITRRGNSAFYSLNGLPVREREDFTVDIAGDIAIGRRVGGTDRYWNSTIHSLEILPHAATDEQLQEWSRV